MGTIPDARSAARAYVRRMTRPPALLLAVALTSLAALAGCALGGGERVGGEPAADTTCLTMLDSLRQEATRVRRRGVDGCRKASSELRVVPTEHDGHRLRSGHDQGRPGRPTPTSPIVGTRAWDDFGAPGTQRALGAPFLVDSYPLQERVLTSDLVETMLAGAATRRPGGDRDPARARSDARSVMAHALAAPRDFRDLAIGTQQSDVADATLLALGARPRRLPLDVGRSARAPRPRRARAPGRRHRERPSRRGRART